MTTRDVRAELMAQYQKQDRDIRNEIADECADLMTAFGRYPDRKNVVRACLRRRGSFSRAADADGAGNSSVDLGPDTSTRKQMPATQLETQIMRRCEDWAAIGNFPNKQSNANNNTQFAISE